MPEYEYPPATSFYLSESNLTSPLFVFISFDVVTCARAGRTITKHPGTLVPGCFVMQYLILYFALFTINVSLPFVLRSI